MRERLKKWDGIKIPSHIVFKNRPVSNDLKPSRPIISIAGLNPAVFLFYRPPFSNWGGFGKLIDCLRVIKFRTFQPKGRDLFGAVDFYISQTVNGLESLNQARFRASRNLGET